MGRRRMGEEEATLKSGAFSSLIQITAQLSIIIEFTE